MLVLEWTPDGELWPARGEGVIGGRMTGEGSFFNEDREMGVGSGVRPEVTECCRGGSVKCFVFLNSVSENPEFL